MEALHWRVIASRLWSDEAARVLHTPLKPTKDAKANADAYKAHAAAQEIHDLLYPKD